MLKKIKIKNFKSLEDFEIEVKPLMLLFGQNSSGKSTFLKALMFLKENLFPLPKLQSIYRLSDEVDLVSFEETVTNNDVKKLISFEFFFEGDQTFPCLNALNSKTYLDIFLNYENFFINHFLTDEVTVKVNNDEAKKEFEKCIKNFDEYNLLEFFDSFVSTWEDYNQELLNNLNDKLYSEFGLKYRIQIDFKKDKFGKDFHKISFYDDIENSFVVFENKGKYILELNSLSIKNNDFLTEQFTDYMSSNFGYDIYPRIPSLNKLNALSDLGAINKEDYHYVMRFIYNVYRILPYLLMGFLDYKHLPSIREKPKNIYIVNKSNGLIDDKQYYGLLEYYVHDQIKLNNLFVEYNKGYANHSFVNDLIALVSKYNNDKINLSSKEMKSIVEIAAIYTKVNNIHSWSNVGNIVDNKFIPLQSTQAQIDDRNISSFAGNSVIMLNIVLKKCGFDDYFMILFDKGVDIAKLYVLIKPNSEVYLSNSSSGMIQVLPIIMILNTLNEKDTYYYRYNLPFMNSNIISMASEPLPNIYIEQPELHLHPKLQCKVAEMLVDSVNSFKSSNFTIIETHSEHIIRKIQVEIAKGNFDKNLIGVYYFDKIDGKTNIKTMEMDNNGLFLEDWPGGFFDDSINLTMDLYEALRNNKN